MDCEKLALGSKCTIIRVEELYAQMEKLLQNGNHIEIEAKEVEQCDTAGLQLLLIFHNELKKEGREMRWLEPSSATLDAAKLIGLEEPLGLTSH